VISRLNVRSINFSRPPCDLRNQFATLFKPMLDSIEILLRKNRDLAETRDLLLLQLVSGQISLPQAEHTAAD